MTFLRDWAVPTWARRSPDPESEHHAGDAPEGQVVGRSLLGASGDPPGLSEPAHAPLRPTAEPADRSIEPGRAPALAPLYSLRRARGLHGHVTRPRMPGEPPGAPPGLAA